MNWPWRRVQKPPHRPLSGQDLEELTDEGLASAAAFGRSGDPAALDRAVELFRSVAARGSADLPDRARHLDNLGVALLDRYELRGDQSDLQGALQAARMATAADLPAHDQRALHLSNRCNAELAAYYGTGDPDCLQEAVHCGRAAVAAAAEEDEDLPLYEENLAVALTAEFESRLRVAEELARRAQQERSAVLLDKAIGAGRAALAAVPENHPQRWVALSNTSFLLRARFEEIGEYRDLSESIQLAREATAAADLATDAELATARTSCAINLSAALLTRFLDMQETAAAEEVVAICRAAAVMAKHPRARATLLSNLVGALQGYGGEPDGILRPGRREALDEAVKLCRVLVRDAAPDDMAAFRANLVNAMVARAWPPGAGVAAARRDVDEAIATAAEARQGLAPETVEWSRAVANEATALSTRWRLVGDREDAAQACERWRRVATSTAAPTAIRITAARDAAALAARAGLKGVTLPMTKAAIQLLPLLAWPGLSWRSRALLLSRWPGLSADATAEDLAEEGPAFAAVTAEHGRTVLWNQLLDLRGDLAAVGACRPDLAYRMRDVRQLLDVTEGDDSGEAMHQHRHGWNDSGVAASPSRTGQATVTQGNDGSAVDRRMALAREWDALVEEVRMLDGFENFLRPPSIEQLLPAAEHGPVVVVNVSRWRCDALVVRTSGVTPVKLPGLTLDDATRRAEEYLSALQGVDVAADAYLQTLDPPDESREAARRQFAAGQAQEAALERVEDLLHELQEWMWSAIAEPVLGELKWHHTPDGPASKWPRLWWCPTGPLTVLPLHSAGFHDDPPGAGRRTVIDRAVSSYTPTLRALLEARAPDRRLTSAASSENAENRDDTADRLLHVVLENTPDQLSLDATQERAAFTSIDESRRAELLGPAATREAVLAALPQHRWVHFTCHGDQNLQDPSRGGLQLYDGRLTIAEIAASRFDGDYAGLGACKSAVGGVELLDEAITLAAALHYTGYRHVVATLWSVDNDVSSEVFASLYRRIVADGRFRPDEAAEALHNAVRELRDRGSGGLRTWTPFIHIGP